MTDDLVKRLRDFDPHLHEWEVVDEAADLIEQLTAERDLWEQRYVSACILLITLECALEQQEEDNAQLRAVMQGAIDIGIIPKSSALDGGANRHSAEIRVADQFRAALYGKDQP